MCLREGQLSDGQAMLKDLLEEVDIKKKTTHA